MMMSSTLRTNTRFPLDSSNPSRFDRTVRTSRTPIPVDRGLFLERSFRMHPELCRFLSDAFYEGRLEPAAGCERQSTGAGVGLRFVPVEHVGNRQFAPEEAEAIADEIARIGVPPEEIIVVAPYNMQVRCLKERLP